MLFQEIDWDDDAPHTDWSEEYVRERPRAKQRLQDQDKPREPKKIDWTNLGKSLAVPWSSWRDCGYKGADSGLEGVAEPAEWPWHVRKQQKQRPQQQQPVEHILSRLSFLLLRPLCWRLPLTATCAEPRSWGQHGC